MSGVLPTPGMAPGTKNPIGTPGDGPGTINPTGDLPRSSEARKEVGSGREVAVKTTGTEAAQVKRRLGPKPIPMPPPPIIDSIKYYSKQHAKLFGRGKLDKHGRRLPIEAAVRKLKERGRARFVLERTWYSPLCPRDRGVGEMRSVPLPKCLCPIAACICCGGVRPPYR